MNGDEILNTLVRDGEVTLAENPTDGQSRAEFVCPSGGTITFVGWDSSVTVWRRMLLKCSIHGGGLPAQ